MLGKPRPRRDPTSEAEHQGLSPGQIVGIFRASSQSPLEGPRTVHGLVDGRTKETVSECRIAPDPPQRGLECGLLPGAGRRVLQHELAGLAEHGDLAAVYVPDLGSLRILGGNCVKMRFGDPFDGNASIVAFFVSRRKKKRKEKAPPQKRRRDMKFESRSRDGCVGWKLAEMEVTADGYLRGGERRPCCFYCS